MDRTWICAANDLNYAGMRIKHFGVFQMNGRQLSRANEMSRKGFKVSVQPMWLMYLVKADYENMGPERMRAGFMFRSMIAAGLEPAAGAERLECFLAMENNTRLHQVVSARFIVNGSP